MEAISGMWAQTEAGYCCQSYLSALRMSMTAPGDPPVARIFGNSCLNMHVMVVPEDLIESGNGLSPTPRLQLTKAPHTFPGMLILAPLSDSNGGLP